MPTFFAWCEANGPALLAGDGGARHMRIAKSVAAKAAIVAEDERETTGRRALLNLGHTFGHALEAETGFSTACSTAKASRRAWHWLSAIRPGAANARAEDAARVAAHLRAVGLPASLSDAGVDANGETLVAHMLHDKKMAAAPCPSCSRAASARPISRRMSIWPTLRPSSTKARG